jgi:hypothetical protein
MPSGRKPLRREQQASATQAAASWTQRCTLQTMPRQAAAVHVPFNEALQHLQRGCALHVADVPSTDLSSDRLNTQGFDALSGSGQAIVWMIVVAHCSYKLPLRVASVPDMGFVPAEAVSPARLDTREGNGGHPHGAEAHGCALQRLRMLGVRAGAVVCSCCWFE